MRTVRRHGARDSWGRSPIGPPRVPSDRLRPGFSGEVDEVASGVLYVRVAVEVVREKEG